ncbi:MAG: lysozyme inhibitor LprI family protein [Cyanobacteria bacterium J06626_6]
MPLKKRRQAVNRTTYRNVRPLLTRCLATGVLVSMMACSPQSTTTVSRDIPSPDSALGSTETEQPPPEPQNSEAIFEDTSIEQKTPAERAGEAESDLSCEDSTTQLEMNQCAQQAYEIADTELNQVYQAMKSQLPATGQQALTEAELAWINFRDLDCGFDRDQYAGGSIAPMLYSRCQAEQTALRAQELVQTELPEQSYRVADDALNQTYESLLSVLREERQRAFVDVQLAWIAYRDRHCAFEVLHSTTVIEESQCLARMSTVRTEQLKADIEQNSL